MRFPIGRCAFLFSLASVAYGQAWTPAKVELDLALGYQLTNAPDHVWSDGSRYDDGAIHSRSLTMDLTYGITDRLAVKAALPYVASRYDGLDPHPNLDILATPAEAAAFCKANHCQDDGRYHGSAQDFSFDVRYALKRRSLRITPTVGWIVPSHDYEYFAHSAIGRGLREFRVGVNAGRRLDPFLRRAFVQGQFNYLVSEKILNYRPNGVSGELQAGYFVNRRLTLIGLTTWTHTIGGHNWDKNVFSELSVREGIEAGAITFDQFQHHDQIDHISALYTGGGATYQVNPAFAVFGTVTTMVAGANGHWVTSAVTLGMNWTVQTRREPSRISRNQALGGSEVLAQARCLCPRQ